MPITRRKFNAGRRPTSAGGYWGASPKFDAGQRPTSAGGWGVSPRFARKRRRPMSDSIESRLKEDRRFQPSEQFCKQARITSHAEYTAMYRRSLDEPEEFWREETFDLVFRTPWTTFCEWTLPKAKFFVGATLNLTESCLDRHLSTESRTKAAIVWEGEPGDVAHAHLLGAPSRGRSPRGDARRPRREDRRPRGDLHGHGARDGHRDARLRAARRDPLGDLRRLQRRRPPRPHQRLRREGAPHAGRLLAPRQHRPAQADGRRGAREDAVDREGHRAPAHRRRAVPPADEGRPRHLVGRRARPRAERRRPRAREEPACVRRGAPALHPLHVGLDREAEGRDAHDGGLPRRRARHDEVRLRYPPEATSTGAPPTSAGSRGTATSCTDRSPAARA